MVVTHGFPGGTAVSRVLVYDWPTADGKRGGSPHLHTASTEAYVVLAGSGVLETLSGAGYGEQTLHPGTVLWFPPGTVHLPRWADAEWLKQLVAEQLVTVRNKRGFARLEWQKLRERNEALDARVYARAAAWIAGADRWSEATWRDLEQQLGASAPDAEPTPDAPPQSAPEPTAGFVRRRRRAHGRRVITPSYLR